MWILNVESEKPRKYILCKPGVYTVGRSSKNIITINGDIRVSRFQGKIVIGEEDFDPHDLGSQRSCTYFNFGRCSAFYKGTEVKGDKGTKVDDGDNDAVFN